MRRSLSSHCLGSISVKAVTKINQSRDQTTPTGGGGAAAARGQAACGGSQPLPVLAQLPLEPLARRGRPTLTRVTGKCVLRPMCCLLAVSLSMY